MEDRRLRCRRIPRIALIPTRYSPWGKVLSPNNNQALITVTGFDFASLQFIFSIIAPLFNNYSPFVGDVISPIDHGMTTDILECIEVYLLCCEREDR